MDKARRLEPLRSKWLRQSKYSRKRKSEKDRGNERPRSYKRPGLGSRVWSLVKAKENSSSSEHLPPASQGPSSRKEF
jgi:hypothetical protein